jgi:hypothetical protein
LLALDEVAGHRFKEAFEHLSVHMPVSLDVDFNPRPLRPEADDDRAPGKGVENCKVLARARTEVQAGPGHDLEKCG